MTRRACRIAAVAAGLATQAALAQPCPGDLEPRGDGVLLVVDGSGRATRRYDADALARLKPAQLTQRQSVAAADARVTERSVAWGGVLLRELLLDGGYGGPADRAARGTLVEARAHDGYRALFSWGELFNSELGDQVIVVRTQDGRALDAAAGPLALRSLADLRPGPRHVRNLCGLTIRG